MSSHQDSNHSASRESNLASLRHILKEAHTAYLEADGSMDSSPTAVILAKEELKIARSDYDYDYDYACKMYVEETLFGELNG